MMAFHNDPTIKSKYIDRVRAHREADNLIRGTGWEEGRGCAVGCTLEAYEHALYETELGIPEWLAHLEDRLFEGMPEADAMLWPERFLQAITPGADLDQVRGPFIVHVLESTLSNFDTEKFPDVTAAVHGSINLWRRDDFGTAAWESARSAARSAAWSAAWSAARSAADSAARSAARSAAWSAAWSAARSAADSAARSAADSAAWSAAYSGFADKLIQLLESCQPRGDNK